MADSYRVQCINAEQARTFMLPQWFGNAASPGSKPDELVIQLDKNQAANLERDFGATPVLIPKVG